MTSPLGLYPLLLKPTLFAKVWGGQRLRGYGKYWPDETAIGESWEVADLAKTSTSGAGGQAVESVIRNGLLAGGTLRDAARCFGGLGARMGPEDRFPLLVKLIDAAEHLSVQVHPSKRHLRPEHGAYEKSECWFVVHASPGSCLYMGTKPDVDTLNLHRAIRNGQLPEVLCQVPARVGDCHFLPAGIIHALGAGVVVAEVQTASDVTYRLHDWNEQYDRPPRTLHIEEAIEVVDSALRVETRRAPDTIGSAIVASCPYFTVVHHQLNADQQLRLRADDPIAVLLLNGAAILNDSEPLGIGDALLIPGTADARLRATEATTLLVAALGEPRSLVF